DDYFDKLANDYVNTIIEKIKYSIDETNPELISSIKKFNEDFEGRSTAFIMMKFSENKIHTEISQVIKDVLATNSITGLRSDDKEYSDDLFTNIKTYMHGSDFGIAVVERVESNDF